MRHELLCSNLDAEKIDVRDGFQPCIRAKILFQAHEACALKWCCHRFFHLLVLEVSIEAQYWNYRKNKTWLPHLGAKKAENRTLDFCFVSF